MGASDWMGHLQGLLAAGVRLHGSALAAAQRVPGFAFDETMTGTVSLNGAGLPSGERRMQVHFQMSAPTLGDYLREGRTDLSGTAAIDGIVEDAPAHGSLWIWPHRRVIRYEFTFAWAGHRLQFAGQKDVRLLDFPRTMTTLPGQIFDEQETPVGTATIVFHWADLPALVSSLRLVREHGG